MNTLYDMSDNMKMLQEMFETGEIDEETFNDTVENLGADVKIENIIYVIRNLEASAKALKEEKEKLAEKQKHAENGVERLKKYITDFMVSTDQKSVKTKLFSVSRTVSKSTEILDEILVPAEYFIPQPPKIDKASILRDLKDGKEVAGCQLKEKDGIRIK